MAWLSAWMCCTALLLAAGGDDPPPNVLVVLMDDVGVDKLAAYGEHPHPAHTPTIDFLASRGVLFRNAWSQSTCSPTRAGLLTGRHPQRHQIGGFIGTTVDVVDLDPGEVSLADVLADVGYRTAAVGKWHLSAENSPVDYLLHPLLLGFEHHLGPITNLPKQEGPGAFFAYEKAVDGVLQFEQAYATTAQVDDALSLIEGFTGEGDQPWFVWLAFSAPHKPWHDPPAHLHGEKLSTPIPVAGGSPEGQADRAPAPPPGPGPAGGAGPAALVPAAGAAQQQQALIPLEGNGPAFVRGALEALDAELGRLVLDLPPGELSQTVVMIVGDNGTIGDAVEPPFDPLHGKTTMFEGGLNVPLIIAGPGIPEGAESQALVHTTDLFATVAQLAGADGSTGVDALDLTPYLVDPSTPDLRGWVYCEEHRPNGTGPYLLREQAARDGRFKLFRRTTYGTPQRPTLYDLQADPFETTDLNHPDLGGLDAEAQAAFDALLAVIDSYALPDGGR